MVSRELLEQILETATWAPNAHNRQPWRFVVLRTLDARDRLAKAMGLDFRRALEADGVAPNEVDALLARSRQRIVQAPVGIVLCMDPTLMDEYEDANRQAGERVMAVQSVALAGGYLLLAAHAVGLGGVWMCAPLFAPETVRETLGLPESWEAQALILLGYPVGAPKQRPRRPVAEVTRYV